ncbi:D-alanyl-D-alanine carboxypeptidase family protein [Rossellomorea aquimaris]|uniref:D-alanyl-D-alanine carboxypeptidase family protein n=1 Tax=Rossellomorea aquimaris TaxID=189382 RepID=UPI001CFD675B|nr:D-alanyl-D-alanine carboxypeptidase family protein [Rossellomorea aquimaris]
MKKRLIVLILFFFMTPSVSAQQNNVNKPRNLYSDSAIVIDSKTGSVLYSKNGDKRMNPASITKIATAIYAIEHANLDDQVKISRKASDIEGSTVYLTAGETLSLEQLLQGLMVNSGNDAAVAIAEHTEGSVKQFVDQLNRFLEKEVGVKDTHFENPHGLYGKNHYTTANDMAKITSYALKNEQFRVLFDIDSVDWKSEGWNTTLYNHHKMVKGEIPYQEVTGGKNGFIDESRHTLVTSAENEKLSIVVVALKAQSKRAIYSDTKKLLDYGLTQFERNTIPKETVFQLNGTSYTLDRDIPFTQSVSSAVIQKLEPDGELTLYNEDSQKIQTTMLTPVKETHIVHSEAVASSEEKGFFFGKQMSQQLLFYPLIIYMALLVIAGVSLFRKNSYHSS